MVLPFLVELDKKLVELLGSLEQRQWHFKTVCRRWTVKDIAAHLLDGTLKRLSAGRDSFFEQTSQIHSQTDLLNFINEQNQYWVDAARRLSPQLIIDLLQRHQSEVHEYLSRLNLHAPALYPVSWAGEETSANWFDIAREFTERWLHQQQIRLAVGADPLTAGSLYLPFLNVCMRALPFHYRDIIADEGTVLEISIVGQPGAIWRIVFENGNWQFDHSDRAAGTSVYIDQNIAWLLFSKGIEPQEAVQYWQVLGNEELGRHVLTMKSFIV